MPVTCGFEVQFRADRGGQRRVYRVVVEYIHDYPDVDVTVLRDRAQVFANARLDGRDLTDVFPSAHTLPQLAHQLYYALTTQLAPHAVRAVGVYEGDTWASYFPLSHD